MTICLIVIASYQVSEAAKEWPNALITQFVHSQFGVSFPWRFIFFLKQKGGFFPWVFSSLNHSYRNFDMVDNSTVRLWRICYQRTSTNKNLYGDLIFYTILVCFINPVCSEPLLWGRNYIVQRFFDHSISGDRYIH